MNSSINIIHKNDFGYIATCKCCNHLQLNLGNVILTLNKNEYTKIEQVIAEVKTLHGNDDFNGKYMIRVNEEDFILSFNQKELNQTIELFELSRILFSANQLIA